MYLPSYLACCIPSSNDTMQRYSTFSSTIASLSDKDYTRLEIPPYTTPRALRRAPRIRRTDSWRLARDRLGDPPPRPSPPPSPPPSAPDHPSNPEYVCLRIYRPISSGGLRVSPVTVEGSCVLTALSGVVVLSRHVEMTRRDSVCSVAHRLLDEPLAGRSDP